jgi:transcriptional regulator with XRE-family HTH domain
MQHTELRKMHPKVKQLWKMAQAEGLSPEQLAPIVGVSFNTIYNWFRGRTPLPNHINLIVGAIWKVVNEKRELEGKRPTAVWIADDEPNPDEVEAEKKVEILFDELMGKLDYVEKPLLENEDNWFGFREVLKLMRKYRIKLPRGIL